MEPPLTMWILWKLFFVKILLVFEVSSLKWEQWWYLEHKVISKKTEACLESRVFFYRKHSSTVAITVLLHKHLSNSRYENILGKLLRATPTFWNTVQALHLSIEKGKALSCEKLCYVLFSPVDKAVLRGGKQFQVKSYTHLDTCIWLSSLWPYSLGFPKPFLLFSFNLIFF